MASASASVIEDLIKGELNWHEKINNNMHKLDDRLSDVASAVSEMSGKLVADTKPTKDSINLITSGAVYDKFNQYEKSFTNETGSYQIDQSSLSVSTQSVYVTNSCEIYYDESIIGSGTVRHVEDYGYVRANMGKVHMYVSQSPKSGNTDTSSYVKYCSLLVTADADEFELSFREKDAQSTYLRFRRTNVYTQDDGTYDIGTSSNKFRNIYATTGTIQTSDANDKKNVNVVDAELASKIIMGLNPVSFKFIDGTSDRTHYGLIAQEVEELVNGLGIDNKDFAALTKSQKIVQKAVRLPVGKDENGEIKYIEEFVEEPVEGEYVYGLRYDEFTAILVKMCQILQEEVNELKSEVAALKNN